MFCLTICQPYAHLIVTPQQELPANCTRKRVENRTWRPIGRGCDLPFTLGIHAGKSREWIRPGEDESFYGPMVFGALIGVARLMAVWNVADIREGKKLTYRDNWLKTHPHVEGPKCWVLEHVRRFREPLFMGGGRSLWTIDDKQVAVAIRTAEVID